MSKQTVWLEAQARNFSEIPNGVRWEAVIFSSEFNRNKYFFDIYKLLRWKGRLEKVLMNNNHNGKYFANSTDKIVDISVSTDENGVTECFAVIESTNEEKRLNPDMVTGFSIELRVDEKDVIANENGEYYTDYEWVGIAYLTGILAGSGDTRILTTKTFAEQFNNNNIMNEEQVKALLAEQKTELLAEFASQAETLKKEFAEEVLSKQQVKTDGMMSWTGEDGVTYTSSWQNIYTEMLTALGNEQPEANQVMEFLAKKFNYKAFEETPEAETQPEPEIAPEVVENDELTKIEMSLNHAEELKKQMKQFADEELVPEVAPTENPTEEAKSFNLYKQISNNLSNLI